MSTPMYPDGKSIRGKKNREGFAAGGVLTAINAANAFLYGIDPVLKQFYGAGIVNYIKKRFTVAQINAGATILAAKPGLKIQMIDCSMAAEGGNAATATSIEVEAVQSTSAVDLISNTVGILTDDTLARMGITNSTLLANGLWAVANDVNTAITISKTGSDLATATHLNVYFTYMVVE